MQQEVKEVHQMRNDAIALAGLLHDIGKFMLRAGVAGRYDWQESVS